MSYSHLGRAAPALAAISAVSIATGADRPIPTKSAPAAPIDIARVLAAMESPQGAHGGLGHPAFARPIDPDAAFPFATQRGAQPALPPLNPLVRGSYVNFESPPVHAL